MQKMKKSKSVKTEIAI